MKRLRLLGNNSFSRNFQGLIFFILILFILKVWVWNPLNSWLLSLILNQFQMSWLSWSNIVIIFKEHIIGAIYLLAIAFFNLWLTYLQFGWLVTCIKWQQEGKTQTSFWQFQALINVIKNYKLSKQIALVIHILPIFPLLLDFISFDIVNYIILSENFIYNTVHNKFLIGTILIFFLSLIYINIRLLSMWQNFFTSNQGLLMLWKKAWVKSRKRVIKISSQLLVTGILYLVGYVIFFGMIYSIESVAIHLNIWGLKNISIGLLGIDQVFSRIIAISCLSKILGFKETIPVQDTKRVKVIGLLIITFALFYNESRIYIGKTQASSILTIAHRAVDGDNAAQNTISALKATYEKSAPDYMEIDIRETKDKQFVVFHDEKLYNLTGVSGKSVHDLTLSELTQLTVKDGKYKSKLASFDDFLSVANQLGQKLLVEIKTSSKDSKNMVNNFLDRYGKALVQGGHQIQSFDKTAINTIRKSKYPLTDFLLTSDKHMKLDKFTGYSIKLKSLTKPLLTQLEDENKPIYVWTVDDSMSMTQALYLGVNGIITDNVSLLKLCLANFKPELNYRELLISQALSHFDPLQLN